MKLATILSCLIAVSATMPAQASGDHADEGTGAHAGHDDKARHGGVVRVVNDVNYELVVKPDSVALYIADHGKPVDLKGASAKLTLLSTAGKSEASLVPTEGRLEAKGSFNAPAGTRALANVTLAGKAPATVRFTLK